MGSVVEYTPRRGLGQDEMVLSNYTRESIATRQECLFRGEVLLAYKEASVLNILEGMSYRRGLVLVLLYPHNQRFCYVKIISQVINAV